MSDDEHVSEKSASLLKRIGPWKTLFLVTGAIALVLAISCYAQSSRLTGDYIRGVITYESIELSLNPLPTATNTRQKEPRRALFRGGLDGSLHLYQYKDGLGLYDADGVSLFGREFPIFELGPTGKHGDLFLAETLASSDRYGLLLERLPSGTSQKLRAALDQPTPDQLLDLTNQLLGEHPDNATFGFWRLHALLHGERYDDAETLLGEWRDRLEAEPDERAAVLFDYAEWLLEELPANGETRSLIWMFLYRPSTKYPFLPPVAAPTLDEQKMLVANSLRTDPLRPASLRYVQPSAYIARCLGDSILASAMTGAMVGKRNESHRLILGLAASTVAGRPAIYPDEGWIDTNLRLRCHRAAVEFYLRGEHQAQDLEAWWPEIEGVAIACGEPVDGESWARYITQVGANRSRLAELAAEDRNAAALWHMLAMGYRVRHYRMITGEWPRETGEALSDSLALESDVPVIDLHAAAPDASLQTRIDGDDFIIWSIGPDGKDDGGALSFDYYKMGSGAGDLVLRILPGTDFGFPRLGEQYSDLAAFHDAYPNGLPSDPTLNWGGPLEVFVDGNMRVWSWGPMNSIVGWESGPDRLPIDVLYDPTNGASSPGLIWESVPIADVDR